MTSDSPHPPAARGATLARRAVRASAWVLGGYAASHVVRLGGNLVLTRLLFPEVFGLASLIQVFLQGLQMFSDVGTAPAIVQSARGDDPKFVNTAWTISCARGFVLWGAAALLARPFASFYGEPLLAQVLPVAGVTAAIGGLESTSIRLAHRHLRAERLVAIELLSQVVNIVTIVALALGLRAARGGLDLGVIWVIVAGGITSGVARVGISHAMKAPFRNRLCIDREALRDLLGFGRWVFLSTMLTFAAGQSDRLLFGKLVPLEVLGVYGVALNLSQIAVQLVQKLGSMVMFPTYSRLASRGELERTFRAARLPLLLAGTVIVAGFLACGPSLIRIMYDGRYADAGWMLQLLAAGAWARVLEATNWAALLGQGRVRWIVSGSAAKLVGLVTLVPLGMYLRGFPGALVGLALSDGLQYAASAIGVGASGLQGFRQDLRMTLALALVSAAAIGLSRAIGDGSEIPEFLVTAMTVGVAGAAAGWWYLRRSRAERAARITLEPGSSA